MLCSIIIPLYNKEDFICDAIESVLGQTHQHFEIIVIDDGSKDNGLARVRTLTDQRISIIAQANQGVSCARNNGIAQAKGDLICFLDADDWYLPSYLETMVNMAEKHPQIAFFGCHYQPVRNSTQMNKYWDPGDTLEFHLIDNFYAFESIGNLIYTGSVAIRRSILEAFKPYFPPGEQWSEDHDLWYRLGEHYQLGYCPAKLVGYRIDVSGSLCAIRNDVTLLPVYQRIEQRALNGQMPVELREDALNLVVEEKITIARNALISGRRYEAITQLLNCFRGLGSKRWWVSLLMCLSVPSAFVKRWQDWRIQRIQS